jgi:NhaD family Na+/H+ antiporter
MTLTAPLFFILFTFVIGYLAIIFEFYVRINKTAVGICIAGLCWLIYFATSSDVHTPYNLLSHHLSDISQILFFLLAGMTLVELIDSHKGFAVVTSLIKTRSKRKVLCIVSILAFFLSAVLDNLTTTILWISILRKLIPRKSDRLVLNCMVVIAANAGGAWTPIGDVTTTMLWINNKITTWAVMREIFLPSLISMLVPLAIFCYSQKGRYPPSELLAKDIKKEPGANVVFWCGLAALLSVPLLKYLTGIPPFMGMILGLAFLWIVTDIMHFRFESRDHLRVPYILTKIDVSSILFFLGILLSVDALQSVGILKAVSVWLDNSIGDLNMIATAIGLFSAIIDNVPLVAAAMGMYDFAIDNQFWILVAFTAGTGGSILSIGSAAGVALMGIEKVDFITYSKKATLPALAGYIIGVVTYLYIA